jgi:hypothetical protein
VAHRPALSGSRGGRRRLMTSERSWPKRRSGPQAREVKADAQAIELAPIMAEIRAKKLQAVADELNARGVRTAMGVRWGVSSVFRLRARIDRLKGIAGTYRATGADGGA